MVPPPHNNAFLDGSACCAESIVHTVLLLFHLHLAVGTYIKHCNATCKFGETLLKLLFVIRALGVGNLVLYLCHTVGNELLVACSANDGSIVPLSQ